jgi:hypothetical protein
MANDAAGPLSNALTYEEARHFAHPKLRGTLVHYLGRNYRVVAAQPVANPAGDAVLFTLEGDDGHVISGIHHSLVYLPGRAR